MDAAPGPTGPGTPPSNIKCRINAGHDRLASTTLSATAYAFTKPFFLFRPPPLCLSRASRRSVPLLFQPPTIYLSIEDRLWGCTTWIGSIADRFLSVLIGFIGSLLILLGPIVGGRCEFRGGWRGCAAKM